MVSCLYTCPAYNTPSGCETNVLGLPSHRYSYVFQRLLQIRSRILSPKASQWLAMIWTFSALDVTKYNPRLLSSLVGIAWRQRLAHTFKWGFRSTYYRIGPGHTDWRRTCSVRWQSRYSWMEIRGKTQGQNVMSRCVRLPVICSLIRI